MTASVPRCTLHVAILILPPRGIASRALTTRFKTAELRWIDTDGINCGIEVEFEDDRLAGGALRKLFEVEENSIWI